MCLEYQKHVSLDIVLETSSIMDAREDCLRCLAHVFGWNACMSGLEDDLASMRCERDYWRKRAEEAEKASTFSQQQTSAAFEQARLLSMYIPSARPEDPTGAGPSSRPLEERLVSPGGGSGVTPASYSGEHRSRSRSRSPGRTCFRPNSPGTIFGAMDVDAAEPPRSSLAGRLENPEETMFPLLGRGEIPNRVNVLLDGTKYLHVQFNDCLYQFEDPHRENVLRNIRRGIAPPLILTRRNHTTHRHDGLPKGAPGWGDEITEWCDFIHRLSRAGCAKKFAGVHKKTDPKHQEPPTDRRLRGFILEGYFAPRFQYDSNRNGWRHSFAQLFVVLGRYRAIVEREGWIIVPGRTSPWSESTNKVLSPFAVAGHLAQNGFSFQEADDLHEWAVAALQDDVAGREPDVEISSELAVAETALEGLERSLEYYEDRAEQAERPTDFRDIESHPGDTLSLMGINVVAGYLAPKQKKKRRSRRKTLPSDEEEEYDSFGEDSWGDDDPGPPWNPPGDQMDVDHSGPSQM